MTADPTRMQALKQLWKQAFGDPDPVVDAFFDTAYAPARHMAIWENGVPVSALYWFDCTCQVKSQGKN